MHSVKFVSVLFILALICPAALAKDSHTYSTWDTVELDTIASAWLIKRSVDPMAEFKFFPKGELITEGIAFDTPDAEYRRTQNKSTFETIVDTYRIVDLKILTLGKIIHNLEINYWQNALLQDSRDIQEDIRALIVASKNNNECLEKGLGYFDAWYKK